MTAGPPAAVPAAFRALRTCYRHPAGATAVAVSRWLVDAGYARLTPPQPGAPAGPGGAPGPGVYHLTPQGLEALAALGVDTRMLRAGDGSPACADYTERLPDGRRGIPHAGGRLGAALTAWLQGRGYAERLPAPATMYERRTLRLTRPGRAALEALGILPAGPR